MRITNTDISLHKQDDRRTKLKIGRNIVKALGKCVQKTITQDATGRNYCKIIAYYCLDKKTILILISSLSDQKYENLYFCYSITLERLDKNWNRDRLQLRIAQAKAAFLRGKIPLICGSRGIKIVRQYLFNILSGSTLYHSRQQTRSCFNNKLCVRTDFIGDVQPQIARYQNFNRNKLRARAQP